MKIEDPEKVLRMPQVIDITGLSRAQIYLLISRHEFPRQIKLTAGGRIAGWLLSEVQEWLDSRIQEREISVHKEFAK